MKKIILAAGTTSLLLAGAFVVGLIGSVPLASAQSVPVGDLSITKTVDNANPAPGDTVNYTITVTAQGPTTSTGVVATDVLPTGLTFENASASMGSFSTSTDQWTIGDMMPSSTATLGIAAMVNSSDTAGMVITNSAQVMESASSTNNNASTSASVAINLAQPVSTSTATSTANLSIAQTADNASPSVGDTVNFMLTVSALGPGTSTGAMVTDMLPSGLMFLDATPSMGTYDSSTGIWTIGDMMPSSTATLGIAAMIGSSTQGTTLTNTATVSESSSSTNMSTSASSSASLSLMVASMASTTATSTTPTSTTATSTSQTPSSTAPYVPPTLSIGQNGSFSADGMMVTSVASGSFQAQIWGITYTINWSGQQFPWFYFRNDTNGSSTTNPSNEIAAGDVVNVTGSINSSSSPFVVNATMVRDDSITSSRHNYSGYGYGSGYNNGYGNGYGYGNGNNGYSGSSSSNGNTGNWQNGYSGSGTGSWGNGNTTTSVSTTTTSYNHGDNSGGNGNNNWNGGGGTGSWSGNESGSGRYNHGDSSQSGQSGSWGNHR